MKRLFSLFAAALLMATTLTLTSCTDSEGNVATPVLAAYKCTAITVSGVPVTAENTKYIKLFSFYAAGTTAGGVYCRVGTDDLQEAASAATSILSSNTEKASWSKFLSKGTYTVTGSTLVLTPKSENVTGEETYTLVGNLGDDQIQIMSSTKIGNSDVDNALGVLGSVLGSLGFANAQELTQTVFTYEKIGLNDLIDFIQTNDNN